LISPSPATGVPPPAALSPTLLSSKDQTLMDKARELEASFLSEMLNYAGLGDTSGRYFGTVGEDQFGSFLRDAQARQMVDKGGIGLAESLFQSLTRMQDGQR
jgi:Rod binding domain-containing protein